jgi:hypothetical protein
MFIGRRRGPGAGVLDLVVNVAVSPLWARGRDEAAALSRFS